MNYEAKVTDLSGTESMLIEDVELDTRRGRRGRILIGVAIIAARLIGGVLRCYGGSDESPSAPEEGGQSPTVSAVGPGRTAVEGTISATGSLAARRAMP